MQTQTHPSLKDRAEIARASEIIKSCVHCGLCTAHCPTYQLLGDERDGPRGRIYLIKQMIETNQGTDNTSTHLDRCLTCRACETVCPSGVQFSELLYTGRRLAEEKTGSKAGLVILKYLLSNLLPYSNRVSLFFGLARLFKPFLPKNLSAKIPPSQMRGAWPAPRHKRQMLVLAGCAQSALTPQTNHSAARVLDRLGISLLIEPQAGCCGAVDHHMGFEDKGKQAMRQNIDAWWPKVESGIEAIVISASACSLQIKEYGKIFSDDPIYAEKAKKISAIARDISEVISGENLSSLNIKKSGPVSVHCPCTLQHGQNGQGLVEDILRTVGLTLSKTRNDHLCCGSAGTYSIQQPAISAGLLERKLEDLTIENPQLIATSNIGCQLHLSSKSKRPVRHWIELLDESEGSSQSQ